MNRRVLTLLLIAASILFIRGVHLYAIFVAKVPLERALGLNVSVENGQLEVLSVLEEFPKGRRTAAAEGGLQKGDVIVAIRGRQGERISIERGIDFGRFWRAIRYGSPFQLEIVRKEGESSREMTISMPATPASVFGIEMWSIQLTFAFLLPLMMIIAGLFMGLMRPQDNTAFLAALLFLSFSSIFGAPLFVFPPVIREFAIVIQSILAGFLLYLFMLFFLLFPSRSVLDQKLPWLKKVFFGFSCIAIALDLVGSTVLLNSFQLFHRYRAAVKPFVPVFVSGAILMLFIGLLSLVLHTVKAETHDEKRKTWILLLGAFVGLMPLAGYITYREITGASFPSFWALLMIGTTVGFFPVSFIYVVLKHRVLGIRLIIRRGLQYALVSRGFFLIEGFIFFLMVHILLFLIRSSNLAEVTSFGFHTLTIASLAFGGAFGLRKFNSRAMSALDRRFFREAYNARQILTDLSHAVRRLAGKPEELFSLVTDKISDSLYPDQVSIFLRHVETVSSRESYLCQGIRSRTGHRDEVWRGAEHYREWELPVDSFLASHLKDFVTEEVDTLDVYLNDPRSWASALAKLDPSDHRQREKDLVETLNIRLIVPLLSGEKLLGFISLGEKLSQEGYSKEDRELLLAVGEQTAIALEYSEMIRKVAEQEVIKREITFAKRVQKRLFPQTFPPMRTLEYTGMCQPARGVGGDYYDFLQIGPGRLGIALGDVSGKGISSALLMASLQALLRSGAPLRLEDLDLLISDINRLMCGSTEGNKYATFFYGLYDDDTRHLVYVNAGHNPPMLFRSSGSEIHKPSTSVERLTTGGMVVGMLENVDYQKDRVQFHPGDLLLIYSDGISEAMNIHDEEYGEDRLMELVRPCFQMPVKDLLDLIMRDVSQFVGSAPQSDDMTLVIVKAS